MYPFSLKLKMTLVVFLLISAVVSAVAGLGLLFFIREFKASVASQQSSAISAMAGELDDKILSAQRELVAVARSVPPALTRDPAGMQRFLDGRADLHQMFRDGTGFLSRQGVLVAISPRWQAIIGKDVSWRDYFKRTVESGKPYISEPFRSSRPEARPIVIFTAPVFDEDGSMTGLLAGRVDLMEPNFLGRLARLKVGLGGNFLLFSKGREMIVHGDRELLPKGYLAPGRSPLLDRAIAGCQGSGEMATPSGLPALSSFTRLTSTGWILAAQLPLAEAYAPIDRARRLVGGSLLLVVPLALWAVWFFMGRLTRPLLLFTRRVGEMGGAGAAGYTPIPIATGDEIGVLAQAFNAMMLEIGSQKRLLEEEKGFSEKLLQHTAVPCFVIDAQHRLIIWNSACEELTGVSGAELLGGREPWRPFYREPRRVLADIVVDGSLEEMADLYQSYADSPLIPDGLRAEGWYLLKGKQRFLSFDAAPVRDSGGRVIAAIQTLQDITMRASTEEELRRMVAAIGESEERFRRLVELSLDGIALLVERRFVFVNPVGCEMLGAIAQEELLGRQMLDFIQRDSQELFEEQLCYVEQSGTSDAPWLEERLVRQDRTTVEVELGASRFVYRGQEGLQVVFRDITERRLAKAKLETLAHYDSLTSLPNRALFFDRLHHVVSEARRYQHPLALMFLDLDRFKQINDTLGHAAGDAVLVEAGRRLKECVRACDMVARMGGDEFTIILSKMAEEPDASLVADRIIDALSRPFAVEGGSASIGVSIGICVYPSHDSDLDGIVRHADLAMYRAKQQGRNCYCFYSQDMAGEAAP
ncbi:MAG TPA: diguanylate cyclase [Geomonas sp.]